MFKWILSPLFIFLTLCIIFANSAEDDQISEIETVSEKSIISHPWSQERGGEATEAIEDVRVGPWSPKLQQEVWGWVKSGEIGQTG